MCRSLCVSLIKCLYFVACYRLVSQPGQTIHHYTNKQENVNPLCLCSNWFQHQQTKAVVWKNTRHAFSNSVIKSSIHSAKSGIYGQIFEHCPRMKNGQYVKISIIKTSGKMPKQQGLCNREQSYPKRTGFQYR